MDFFIKRCDAKYSKCPKCILFTKPQKEKSKELGVQMSQQPFSTQAWFYLLCSRHIEQDQQLQKLVANRKWKNDSGAQGHTLFLSSQWELAT